MTQMKETVEEISQTVACLVTAFDQNDKKIFNRFISPDVEIHANELNLLGRSAFFKFYHPEHLSLSEFSVKTSGGVGWGYGTLDRKKTRMHFSAVFTEGKPHEWQLVHLHINDVCL